VLVLLAPVPDLAARDLPLGGGRAYRSSAALALERPADREQVGIASGQAELADVDGQSEAHVETIEVLEEVAVALDLEHRLVQVRDRADMAGRVVWCSGGQVLREDIDGQRRVERQAGVEESLEVSRRIERGRLPFGPGVDRREVSRQEPSLTCHELLELGIGKRARPAAWVALAGHARQLDLVRV